MRHKLALNDTGMLPMKPIDRTALDPRLLAWLEPTETVTWQGTPKPGSLPPRGLIVGGVLLILLGLGLALGLAGPLVAEKAAYASAIAAFGLGVMLLVQSWQRRAARWVYAITDRRLISVLGTRLVRSVTPEDLDRQKLKISGDTVYWYRQTSERRSNFDAQNQSGPDGRLVGFHGQTDPQATLARIQAWRAGISQRAGTQSGEFRAALNASRQNISAAPVPVGIQRVVHPATGLSLDLPQDWRVNVRSYQDGPLRLFGVTLLPKVIREGSERPYGAPGNWNALSVKAAPEAGLDIVIHDRGLQIALDQVVNDNWSNLTGSKVIRVEQKLQIGPLHGFGVTRGLPAGFEIKNLPALSGPMLMRQLWLEGDGFSLEVKAYALERQTDLWHGLDDAIASLDTAAPVAADAGAAQR